MRVLEQIKTAEDSFSVHGQVRMCNSTYQVCGGQFDNRLTTFGKPSFSGDVRFAVVHAINYDC